MIYILGQDTVLELECREKEGSAKVSLYFNISEYMDKVKKQNKKSNSKFLKSVKPMDFPEGISLRKPIVLKRLSPVKKYRNSKSNIWKKVSGL